MKKKEVIAYEAEGVKTFPDIKAAAEYYGVAHQRIVGLIMTGEMLGEDEEVTFDYINIK